MPMNLTHALEHHPLRDDRVWGCKCRFLAMPKTPELAWQYSNGAGGWSINRMPMAALTLRGAFNAYVNALQSYSRVHIFRIYTHLDQTFTVEDEHALDFLTYKNPIDEIYTKLRSKGAIIPAACVPSVTA